MHITWIAIMIFASLILAGLGVYGLRHRMVTGALSFSLLMFAIAGWSLSYALELLSQDLATKLLWIRIEYPFIVATPVLWLAFALQYTGQGRWLSRRNAILLSLVPVCTVVLVWTNQAHRLFYNQYLVEVSSGWPMLHVEYGPGFWVHILYSYLCLLAGTLLLGRAFFHSSPLYRKQAGVLLVGALIPWIGNVLYLFRLSPWPDLDHTLLAFALSGLVLAYGLFRYRLLQVIPVARRVVVDGMPTAMIVLDAENRIADLNPAARQLFSLADRQVIGQPARQVLGPAELVARFGQVAQADTEVEWGEGDSRQVYQVAISPLDEKMAGIPARLILVTDITEQVRAQEMLSQQNRQLALLHEIARVASSTLDLPTLYQLLADTLAQIVGGDGCYITQIDEATGQVVGGAAYGPFRDSYHGLRPPPGERTVTESVLEAGRPLAIPDVFDSPHISPRVAEMFPARSQLGLPLRLSGRNLGAVLIAFNEPHTFTDEEITWATQAVDLAALALENARLFHRVEQSKREWETTFDTMPDLIAILDREHRIRRVNKAMASRLGVTPKDAVGLLCYNCVHGTEEPPSYCPHTELLADGQEHTVEVQEGRLGGDFLVTVSPIRDSDGQLLGSVHVAHDITKRKRVEREREQLIVELQGALAQVKTLSGLLPICANCKKIRDDQGYWHGVEVYVRDHSEAQFSHGICPECMTDLYPWFENTEE